MEFHRKSGKNVRRVEKSISLSLPIPFAYACVENKIEKAQGIPFRVVHIENFGNKPVSFYFNVGISNTKPESSLSLDFTPVVCIRIENDECLGEFFACISRRGYFHVYKGNYCIYTKALIHGVNPKSPLYVCFEIFRVRIKLVDISYCVHSDTIDDHRGTITYTPYC